MMEEAQHDLGRPALAPVVLDFRGVSKQYLASGSSGRVQALEAVDLQIRRGECVTFVGPSGCGKTTLLNITAALLEASDGQILFDGAPHTEPNREISVMFQSPVLLPWRTVEQNALLPAEIFGIKSSDIVARVREVLGLVGLGEFMNTYPDHLSGGMQQRNALARVLAYDPQVILMDEPFGALDEFTREAMNLELARLTRPRGMTVLFVTHNIPEAVFLADRVVVMTPRPGRVAGVIDVPFDHPRTTEIMRDPVFTDLVFQIRSILAT